MTRGAREHVVPSQRESTHIMRLNTCSPRNAPGLVPLLLSILALSAIPISVRAQGLDSTAVVARVAAAVCDKQVVLLGELPSHGEARGFQAKAAIVRRLVEQCGFDAVLFEAPMYDFVGFQESVAGKTAAQPQLDKAIGRFWWTRELAEWRAWLFRQAMERGLVVGGLDDQVSVTSEYARATLPGLVAASSPPNLAAECEAAVDRHLFWRYDAATPFEEPEKTRLQRCVRGAADSVVRAEGNHGSPVQAMLESFAGYVDRTRGAPAQPERDEAMYRNALWHLGRLPAESKVVVWTATVHAARAQGGLSQQPLGAKLAAQFSGRLGAIGFTAYGGWSSMAAQPRKQLADAPAGSLEEKATSGGVAWAYLDTAALRSLGEKPSRLFGRIATADWSKLFDGIVVIREEVAPTFDPWR